MKKKKYMMVVILMFVNILFFIQKLQEIENRSAGPMMDFVVKNHTRPKRHRAYGSVHQIGEPEEIWPSAAASDDRILQQLRLTSRDVHIKHTKTILLYDGHGLDDAQVEGYDVFTRNDCPIHDCYVTLDVTSQFYRSDAVLFRRRLPLEFNLELKQQAGYQVWILAGTESPQYSRPDYPYTNLVNWTASYRRDSTIVTSHMKYINTNMTNRLPSNSYINSNLNINHDPMRNYASEKNNKVAWIARSCNTMNRRLEYIGQLQKHIQVDVFGQCGNVECKQLDCADILKHYKFYLAFETSNCIDYISERLFMRAFSNDVLPIVMGARPEDYAAVAPPMSYIHVDDFDSPKHLAEYLHKLDQNDDLYNQYFRWKGTGEFINTKFWCRLCAMLHATDDFNMWYTDIKNWWAGPDVCVMPKNSTTWATWRDLPKQTLVN